MDWAQASAASLALVGSTIADRYRLDKLIGEGGMGAVFQATHLLMRKRVAVKLLHADLSHDEEVLGRFRREAQAAARIDHPNVAAATDFGQLPDGSFFLVLEFVEGTGLNEVIAKGRLDAARALNIVRQIAVALEKAHEVGVIHRDLKPENIMLVRKDADPDFVKVLDFGIAKLESPNTRDGKQLVTRFGTILGTPEYMSPEQAAGDPAGAGADFYSVGVMLYEMLTQKLPFDDADRTKILSLHIIAPPPKMDVRAPGIDVPSPIERLTLALLAKEPKHRPESAGALRAAIESAAMEAGLTLPHLNSTRTLPRDVTSEPAVPVPSASVKRTEHGPSWQPADALAKTQIGILTETVPGEPVPAALAQTRPTGIPGLRIGPLDKLPRPLAIAALGAPFFLAAFVIVVVAMLVSHRPARNIDDSEAGVDVDAATPAIKAEGPAKAPWAKIAAAKAGGLAAMEQLLAQFPDDDNVQAELADSAVVAAQKPETAEDGFAILENELGSRGVDGLMKLASGKAVPNAAKQRATASLAKPEIRSKASLAAGVALDLRSSYKCQSKHDLLATARESGDVRSLQSLQELKWTRGCGFLKRSDCWECLRKDTDLDDAIAAVKSRQALERDR